MTQNRNDAYDGWMMLPDEPEWDMIDQCLDCGDWYSDDTNALEASNLDRCTCRECCRNGTCTVYHDDEECDDWVEEGVKE